MRYRKKVLFVIVTEDLSDGSLAKLLAALKDTPVFRRYTSETLSDHLGLRGVKVVGFKRSSLSGSILKELTKVASPLPRPDREKTKPSPESLV